jgi:FkbM family methyltransferase
MEIPRSHTPSIRQRVRRLVGLPIYAFLLRFRPYSSLTSFERFVRDGYSRILERNLKLSSDSVVLDFGGYIGDVSWRLHSRYHPRIHIFEPVPQFVEILRKRFKGCDNVTIHAFAIGASDKKETFGIHAAGTGRFMQAATMVEVEFRDVSRVIPELPKTADLAIINIEGGEYDLIPCLQACGFLRKVKQLLIQFHGVGEDPAGSRHECRRLLAIDHEEDWSYDFVWESWRLRSEAAKDYQAR